MNIGFIGMGNMANAMIGGILQKKGAEKIEICVSDLNKLALKDAKKKFDKDICIREDNQTVAKEADFLILAVKPQYYQAVITDIKDYIKEQVIITIAPGLSMEWVEEQFGQHLPIVRCMPNTPALVGEGCTGVCCNNLVTEENKKAIFFILNSFGKAIEIPEQLMAAVVGVSGSAPAYVFLFIEAMADGAVAAGMPRAQAYGFAARAVMGSAKMVLETGKHPGELKDMVCSPGGTSIQGVKVLEEKGFRAAVMNAVEATIQKTRELQ